jgi:2-polyprenyl-3-methyl-5-hydroxy-6-metoxy-1,4-benzoquinol methylase
VGAAHGALARLLSQQGFVVTAIELDPELAGLTRQTGTEVVEVDLDQSIPDFSEPFDVIVYGDVLEHLKDPLRVLTGLNRYLAAEGKIVVSVPNVTHIVIRLMLLFGYFEYMNRGILDRTHLRFFTLRSFRRLLAQGGVRVEELVVTPVPLSLLIPPWWQGRVFDAVNYLNALSARLFKRLLGYQFVAFGQLETKRCAPRSP